MGALQFKIKICGVTSVDDARMVAEAGADAIGLNFYPGSSRYLALERAQEIALSVPKGVTKVGVFVNTSFEDVSRAIHNVPLDCVQFHGDEPVELLSQFGGMPIVRAWRWENDGGAALGNYLAQCASAGFEPAGVLLDAAKYGQYGGTGATADWESIAKWRQSGVAKVPVILAGGLTADNVGLAIVATSPDAVDTASGVESSPGRKDLQLVKRFVDAARQALTRNA